MDTQMFDDRQYEDEDKEATKEFIPDGEIEERESRVMEASITDKNEDCVYIEWSENREFGTIKLYYTENGQYTIDAEFIGIDRLLRVFKALDIELG